MNQPHLSLSSLDWQSIRQDFPLLSRRVHRDKPLIYFDNANTTQKPATVIQAVDHFYQQTNANVSRAIHVLGNEATQAYERARTALAKFLNVPSREVVLCSGTTFALNLVAYSWALPTLQTGDVILISQMEHHANIVPWQLIAHRCGASIAVIPITTDGQIDMQALRRLIAKPRVKLLAITHVSNVLGTINPIQSICALARAHGVISVIDGSQAAPHCPLDLPALGCDFYALTGHKLYGPTGTGALWARWQHLEQMPPFFGGGEMIRHVQLESSTFNDPPYKFEAGTPNIAGQVGLATALDYLQSVGLTAIQAQETQLHAHLREELQQMKGVQLLGSAVEKAAIVTFVMDHAQAHDIATLLDLEGVAIRSGQHCAHPLFSFFGVTSACRASLAFYNTHEEIDQFIRALRRVRRLLVE